MTLHGEVYAAARAAAARRLHEPDPQFRALIDEGRSLADQGDFEAAERLFKGALLATRGVSKANETYALASLMTVYQRSRRHFESVVLSRLLTDRLVGAGETAKGAGCLATHASCLTTLGLHKQTEQVLEQLSKLIATFPVEANTMAHENFQYLSAALAARQGRTLDAEEHLAAYRQIKPIGEGRSWRKPMEDAYLEGLIALSKNDPSRAVERLNHAYATTPETESRLRIRRAKVEALLHRGDLSEAQAAARALLKATQQLEKDPFSASMRLQLASWLALWIDNHGGEIALVHKAYDLAAAAVIERICQLDRAVDELPELGVDGVAHLSGLKDMRKQFVTEQKELLARVADFLHTTDGGIAADVLYGDKQDGYVRVCAWCESLSTDEAKWLPIGHYVPRGRQSLRITHTICPSCAAEIN